MMKNIFDFRGHVQIRVSIKRRRATWAVCTLPYVSQQGMQELRWREIRAPKRIQQAAQQQQCGYACIQARLISTNPESMEEACEYGLPRGTCFVARRLELVAVAGLLWISLCVLGWVGF